jgi:pimeloyl-ACP methyl ester carboxylesterase
MSPRPQPPPSFDSPAPPLADARGVSQLAADAVVGVVHVVEGMHRTITAVAPVIGPPVPGRARGISGLVYRSVRGITRVVGSGLDVALDQFTPLVSREGASPRRDAAVAAINGLWGDHLADTENPLAIPMHLRHAERPLALNRQTLASDVAPSSGKLLVLVHGLCMNERNWRSAAHDHGAALARDLGYTPLYLRYNTGRHIATNGREFAALLERLVHEWPVPISEIVLLGHSMGGLVARSACHYAEQAGHGWLRHLEKIVCLGTPHHGAPLERAGNQLDALLDISPYTAPFTRLGRARSAGIKDLRYGHILNEEDPGKRRPPTADTQAALPDEVRCFVIAAAKEARPYGLSAELLGDGLVPVSSALGRHRDAALSLPIPPSQQRVCYGLGHFDLLDSHEVYDQLHDWLADGQ